MSGLERQVLLSVLDARWRHVAVEHRKNGLAIPLASMPEGWGRLFYIWDAFPSDVPGPHKFERVPLRATVRQVKDIRIALFAPDTFGKPHPQFGENIGKLLLADLFSNLQGGRSALLVMTIWSMLSPWEALFQDEAMPGSKVRVIDIVGERSLRFRCRGHLKPARSRS